MDLAASASREPAFIRTAAAIRDDILGGRLLSGTSLIEADLICVYGVSRNTLREALQLLRQQGLVSQEPNKSVRVKRLGLAELRDVFVVRRLVEPSAMRGRTSVSQEWIDRLGDVIRSEGEAIAIADWPGVARQSLRFHQEIVSLHGSPILDRMFSLLITQLRLVFISGKDAQAFHEPWLTREAEMYRLIQLGDWETAADQLEHYLADSEAVLTTLV